MKTAVKNAINSLPKSSVFGAAPSLSAMQTANSLNKKVMFRGATFWYYFRVYLPYCFPVIFLVFMIVALTAMKTVQGNLLLGSILSLFMSLSVVVSYVMIIPWRKHPSSLVLYRAMTSILFSINIILEAISTNNGSCRKYATFTQFTLLAGESWQTTIALDLVYSLTNPFISYKSNLKKYQIIVWTFTAFLSFVFYFDTRCQGKFDQGICWVKITSTNSPCLWGYYLFWMICMYSYQIYATGFAWLRLRKGLALTFEIRKKCAEETFKCLFTYAIYISTLMFMFAIISSDPSPAAGSSMANFSLFFLFVIANRGSIDGIVWFMLHDFIRDGDGGDVTPTANYSKLEQGTADGLEVDGDDDQASSHVDSVSHSTTHGLIHDVAGELKQVKEKVTGAITEIADLAIAEMDETDLSPQVNTALRAQIVQYVTKGVNNAVRREDIGHATNDEFKHIMDNMFRRKDPALVDGLQVLEFLLEKEHPFKAFAPDMFKALRLNEGIDDDKYLRILSASANERLSEGASGAFMFFCGGGEFIVKTIKPAEARVLHSSLYTYSKYLKNNSNSLLCRFLGSYSLEMYSQTFYFVVMLNCFDPSAYINERFDIKGSWVGRSAEPAKRTKRVVCRHCNEYFVPSKGEKCGSIVGEHEANVVLKDNDLRTKISLPVNDATSVVEILRKDSELLSQLGVLDYSLLLGIKKWKFEVGITDEMMAFNPKSTSGGKSKTAISPTSAKSTFPAKTVTGPAVYHLGIVDFLQDWTLRKRIERAFKIYVTRKDPDGLSVMHPEAYQQRFQNKMEQIFDLDGIGGGVGYVKESSDRGGASKSSDGDNNKVSSRTGDKSAKKPVVETFNPLQSSGSTIVDKPTKAKKDSDMSTIISQSSGTKQLPAAAVDKTQHVAAAAKKKAGKKHLRSDEGECDVPTTSQQKGGAIPYNMIASSDEDEYQSIDMMAASSLSQSRKDDDMELEAVLDF